MAALFDSGFSLNQIVDFMLIANFFNCKKMVMMKEMLSNGSAITDIFKKLGFQERFVAQIELSMVHGNFSMCLKSIRDTLIYQNQHRKKIIQVATYPIILIVFLVLITLGLRQYLLPQVESENWATILIMQGPLFFSIAFVCMIMICFSLIFYYKNKNPLIKLNLLAKIPIINDYVKNYHTAFFAREFSLLFATGLDLKEITILLCDLKQMNLLKSIGILLEKRLLEGETFHQAIVKLPFLRPELALIIQTGEVNNNLYKELEVYAEECEQHFFFQMNQLLQLIQPLVFMLVGIVILCIYAAMLLPMYQNMEGMI